MTAAIACTLTPAGSAVRREKSVESLDCLLRIPTGLEPLCSVLGPHKSMLVKCSLSVGHFLSLSAPFVASQKMCGTNTFDNKVSNMKLCTCASSTFQHLTGVPLLKDLPSVGYHCRPFKKHALDSDTQDQHASQQSVCTPRVAAGPRDFTPQHPSAVRVSSAHHPQLPEAALSRVPKGLEIRVNSQGVSAEALPHHRHHRVFPRESPDTADAAGWLLRGFIHYDGRVCIKPSEDQHEQHCLYREQLAISLEFRRAVCSMSLAHAEEWRKDQALVNSDADGSVCTILIPYQQYSWSPTSQHFNEERYSPAPRNMKGLTGSRTQPQLCAGHTCGLSPPDDCEHPHDHMHHGPDVRQPYLLSPAESCPMDHHRCSPRSSVHSECMMMPVMLGDHVSSSTFPRMHYSSHYDTRDDCAMTHTNTKVNRIPANLLDQFEKQLPLHRDGFHTLQYQRASAATEQRNESPGRIRHLVHSVQKLFTKSHSLEGSSKSNINGTKSDSRVDDHHHSHHSKHSKRSKSKERKPEGKHKSGMSSWWSSDDNLDSDSTYRTPSVANRHHMDHISHCYPEALQSPFGDLSLKTSKSNSDVKCSACEGLALTPDTRYMKRSSWSTLTVSQAKEAYRKSSLNLDKPLVHPEIKPSLRPCHYLQVPQDDWGAYPTGGKEDEIPCRRMRSGSYIKAMGDEESGESDSSPKTSPKVTLRPEPLLKSIVQRPLGDHQTQSYLQAASEVPVGHSLDPSVNYNSPKFRSRNQSYMRAVSTLSQASCVSQMSEAEVNGQFESVCESVFSEVESQAMDALDLPGCFRTRSHSYLRAIQAGYSQDDECIPVMTPSNMTSTIRSTADRVFFPHLQPKSTVNHRPRSDGSMQRTVQSVPVDVHGIPALAVIHLSASQKPPTPIASGNPEKPPDLCIELKHRNAVVVPDEYMINQHQEPQEACRLKETFSSSPLVQATVSYTNYKKTPPPVPPRTTSKPLISVTAQSSTESTQDAYQDSRAQRMSPWTQDSRGLYNSMDSLDSNKAMNLALETAAAQRHATEAQSGSTRTSDKAILVSKAEELLKSRCSSIGVQVETATDSDTESRGLREYHSVGVQVEDEKRHGRFKRSNSVTAAVQADLELEGFPGHITMEDKGLQFGSSFQRHSEPSTPTQYGALRTVRTQGLFSYREDYRTQVDTATLPPPDPWLEPSLDTVETGRMSPCRRDGSWFLKLLHTETKRMEGWCKEMEREAEENDLSEEILGKIRSAVGSAQLLMSQKFQQFYWLCQQNMDPSAMPRPTSQDLAGYWDMLQLSVEDVSMKFDELHQLKLNDWKIIESPERKEERKIPPPIPKKPPKGKFPITREKSLDLPDRQRQEARRRLMAAKRAASFRQNSATERADSIEIYIPEAQTRL
ncbi:Disks large-associated protein 2 [Microtus ochrogaster]|uniref:Disks large-associated protein 2 n=1 Tax=Microtus ochrogaster TaxID=79684 RepID=A0A8J6G8Z5_MICOH|nr:Disks large-associated protein 2 [Microtus ochrogaster]